MEPNLLAHNENSSYVMPCVTAHAGKPATLCIHGTPEITYGCAIQTSQMIYIKNNCLTF